MKKAVVFTTLALLTFVLYGCGSGDFFNSSGTTISGVASKGPIKGAKIAIFAVTTSGRIDKQLATTTTATDGTYSANLGSYTGAIFATMSGSSASYTDETNPTTPTLLGAQKLHAVSVVKPGAQDPKGLSRYLAITPFTDLAYQKAATLKAADIATANTLISTLFLQGTDIISTLPANILSSAAAVTDADKINYSLTLAAFSKFIASSDIGSGVTLLSSAISSSGTFTPPAAWTTAVASLTSNTNIQTTLTSVPVVTAFTPTTYSAIINQPVTLTVKVTKFDGSALAGATVAFATSSGTLSTPAVTDANGNTTVILTPSAVGAITVNASATASGVTVATKTAATVTVVNDPNDPGSVTLASSASSVQTGQTVTLTATVGVVGGGPNNITPGSAPSPAVTVTFKITSDTSGKAVLSAATATTNASGVATVTITSGTVGTITVTATAGTTTPVTSSPATVSFTPNPLAPATVTVSAAPASIQADGATASTITATVTNYLGTALSGVTVTFTTTGGTLGAASAATTDTNGKVTIPLTSTSAGTATVTASATAAGVTQTGTTTATFTTYTRPTKAIVILGTSGTFASGSAIGAINCDVTFPTAKGLTLSSAVLSGVTTSVTPNPSLASNVATAGDLSLALQANLSGSTTVGFPLGQFVTVTFTIPSGTTLPVTSDFAVATGSEVDNTSAVAQSGISITILSVTFQ